MQYEEYGLAARLEIGHLTSHSGPFIVRKRPLLPGLRHIKRQGQRQQQRLVQYDQTVSSEGETLAANGSITEAGDRGRNRD